MKRSELIPIAVAVLSALLWGLWWIPIRFLNRHGFEGAEAGFAINVAALPFVLAATLLFSGRWNLQPRAIVGAALVGFAVTTYGTALAYADVVRVVLLFYLAPAWSTIIECAFMGRRWTWQSALAMTVSLSGMLLILGSDLSWEAVGVGELTALLSGMAWSVGAAMLFSVKGVNTGLATLCAVAAAVVTGGLAVLVESGAASAVQSSGSDSGSLMVALLAGGVYFAPMIALTLWSARLLPPALMSFLLSAEIISGVGSSALMLDERFGMVELAGTVCITCGVLIEFLLPSRTRSKSLEEA